MSMKNSGIESATFRLVEQCLTQMRHRVAPHKGQTATLPDRQLHILFWEFTHKTIYWYVRVLLVSRVCSTSIRSVCECDGARFVRRRLGQPGRAGKLPTQSYTVQLTGRDCLPPQLGFCFTFPCLWPGFSAFTSVTRVTLLSNVLCINAVGRQPKQRFNTPKTT